MSVKLFCDRCGPECKKHWELRVHTDASCLRPDFTRELCKSCAADIAVEALAKKDAWISVQDRLPEEGYVVLAIASGCPHANIILKEAYQIAEWCHEGGWILQEFPEWEDAEVTHWMPLPEPPKEE